MIVCLSSLIGLLALLMLLLLLAFCRLALYFGFMASATAVGNRRALAGVFALAHRLAICCCFRILLPLANFLACLFVRFVTSRCRCC